MYNYLINKESIYSASSTDKPVPPLILYTPVDSPVNYSNNEEVEIGDKTIAISSNTNSHEFQHQPSRIKCLICEQTFTENSHLHVHMSLKHKRMKPYRCEFCAKSFSQQDSMVVHQQIDHTNHEKLYLCSICTGNPRFISANEYIEHMKTKHKKPYKCLLCIKCCNTSAELKIHERTHAMDRKQWKCTKCNDFFSFENSLKLHINKMHTNNDNCFDDKPFLIDCPLCDQNFLKKSDLNTHLYVHIDETPYECPDCAMLFEKLSLFQDHMKIHDKNDQLIDNTFDDNDINIDQNDVYDNDDQDTTEQKYSEHSLATNNKIENDLAMLGVTITYTCPICEQLFNDIFEFNNHTKTHQTIPLTGTQKQQSTRKVHLTKEKKPRAPVSLEWQKNDNKIRNFTCKECSRSFTLASTLQLHHRRTHLGIKPYECSVCQWKFAQSSDLIKHMRKHTGERPYTCSYCDFSFSQKRNLKNHIKMHLNPPSICKYCNKEFLLGTSLTQHLKIHEGPNSIQCAHCMIQFSNGIELQKHINRLHSDTKIYSCTVCDKHFAKTCDLRKHQRIHSGERPYTCKLCDKTFSHATSLRNHGAVHTGERPYQCSFCGQSFSFHGNLKVHQRCHTGERPFQCNVCKKQFARSANLNEHKKIHTGERSYKCDICDKSFTNSSTYSKHRKIHTGEKPHKCTFCDKAFIQLAHLTKHLRIHTGEKPYACKICQKNFRRSDTLANHLKIHRKDEATVKNNSLRSVNKVNLHVQQPPANDSDNNCKQYILSTESPSIIQSEENQTIPLTIILTNPIEPMEQSSTIMPSVETQNLPQIMYTITTPNSNLTKVGNFELSTTNPALNPHFIITQL